MASSVNAAYCALVATAFWMLIGFALGRHLLSREVAIGAAPILGWAVYNSITLPILMLIGFSFACITGVAVLCLIASIVALRTPTRPSEPSPVTIPWWAFVTAGALALVPAAAIAPKISPDSVAVAAPIFDHSKIAIIDAMLRLGLPPVNPFFGENGEPGRLVYYYLWYFGAAQAARVLGVSGWEADIGLTWFAAFSSLSLMMGIAVWVSRRSIAGMWVGLLTCATSVRDLLAMVVGPERVNTVVVPATGFGSWLYQAGWVPQHLTAASCVVAAMLLMSQYAHRQTIPRLIVLALVIVAGFECSTYVGGVTFAIAALIAVPILYARLDPANRVYFIAGLAAAAAIAISLAAPFILAQIATIGQRAIGAPIVIDQFDVLSYALPHTLRRMLDLPAYWLILLPVEFPAVYVAGALSLVALLRVSLPASQRTAIVACVVLALTGLAVSWLLVIDVGGNNDLRMRAVLPSAMVLIATTAASIVMRPRRMAIIVTAVVGLLLSLPHTINLIHYNFIGDAAADGKVFAHTPELWTAVRRHTAADRRVGNNPQFLQDLTPWPVNLSWALLADRSSCFASDALVVAYVAMPRERREMIHAQFVRVFEGKPDANDISDLATRYGCDVIVVTAEDRAWQSDPFAKSPLYALVETREGRWRIYKANPRRDLSGETNR